MEQYIAPKQNSNSFSTMNIFLIIVIIILSIILLTLLFVCSPMTIIGDSMVNTFHDGDHIFLLKFGYDLNYGDVVIFHKTELSEKKIIKRVIGLPGDYIRFNREEKAWYRNDQILNEEYTAENEYSSQYMSPAQSRDLELYSKLTSGSGIEVGENELFVLGDNRNYSQDSHVYGCISQDWLVGKYLFSY